MNNFKFKSGSSDCLLFLFGLFALTQVSFIGSIGISELVGYAVAPLLFVIDYRNLRHDGFLPAIYLAMMVCLGCIVSSLYNHTPFILGLKGTAQVYSLFAYPVLLHRLLRRNLSGLRWMLLGLCISRIINVFVFRQGFEVSMLSGGYEDAATTEMIMNGPLFWMQRLGGFLVLPVQGWFYNTPTIYAVVATMAMAIFTVATSDSGRSALACTIGGVILLMLGRRRITAMKKISRYIWLLALAGMVVAVAMKTGYKYMAQNRMLNEKAQRKYEGQVKDSNSMLSMLVGGRSECFAGLLACFDNPIWGFGPWSVDSKNYYGEFVAKYGAYEDYADYMKNRQRYIEMRIYPPMPTHSHIVGFWVRYGILGLPYWFYVLYLMYRFLKHNIAAIPQWFGLLSIMVVNNLWHIFFSPFGMRVEDCMFVVCLLFSDAVGRGRIALPQDMIQEICKKDQSVRAGGVGRMY